MFLDCSRSHVPQCSATSVFIAHAVARSSLRLLSSQVMNKPGLHMVIGGKSLGKSKVLQCISTAKFQPQDPLLLVDMRRPPLTGSTDVLECLQEVAKKRWTEDTMPAWLEPVIEGTKQFFPSLSKAEMRESDQGLKVAAVAAAAVAATAGVKKPTRFVEEFVAAASADRLTPVIIIDEASIAFPGGNGYGKKAAAEAALALFVAISKQQEQVSAACWFESMAVAIWLQLSPLLLLRY